MIQAFYQNKKWALWAYGGLAILLISLYAQVQLTVAINKWYGAFNHYGYFDIWLNSFEQLMIIVPYIIVGPSLFTGAITLGVLVQVSNAFSKVRESFSIFIGNWTTITELRSIHKRLREFEHNIGYKQR